MTTAKRDRPSKRQLGQFITPESVAGQMLADIELTADTRILEPSLGDGAFILPLVRRLVALHTGSPAERLSKVLADNLHGVELDHKLHARCLQRVAAEFGNLPEKHNLVHADFFHHEFEASWRWGPDGLDDRLTFDLVVGNPPFGGTFDASIEDELDRDYGERFGHKIKKETYAFFIVKCVERLNRDGRLLFICSDSLLTIPTMKGLRVFLMNEGQVRVRRLPEFSDETTYPMVVLDFRRNGRSEAVIRDGERISRATVEMSENKSWGMSEDLRPAFAGPTIGNFMVGTSGMTIGKNKYFVRKIVNGSILEPYRFEFHEEPITLEGELARARLGKLSLRKQEQIRQQERLGETRRCVRVLPREKPLTIRLPHADYKQYNKSNGKIVHSEPDHVVYWRNAGEAVLTFKKSGNWYLRGVGGQPFFEREGLTWQLIASRLKTRYLPAGCILDSGAPCGFLLPGVPHDELLLVLAWTLSPLCSRILKSVINHTMNIQSKDFERLPYPYWVNPEAKEEAIRRMRDLIDHARNGEPFSFDSPEIITLGKAFDFHT
ncbi:MAG: N-6 DNA methylase [Candidatus Nealsonbacteria bacterium]|nr:N-6 DNA methylase [Candidatus Nealsonbacteria bacterium]